MLEAEELEAAAIAKEQAAKERAKLAELAYEHELKSKENETHKLFQKLL